MGTANLPVISFASVKEWEAWLAKNHADSAGIWLKLAKKDAGIATVTYGEALKVALCHGWIDGQGSEFDDKHWLVKFTPRGPKSIWSKRNRDLVAQLTADGKMRPSGLEKVQAAKKDGRWEQAYDSEKHGSPRGFFGRTCKEQESNGIFQDAQQSKHLCYCVEAPDRKKPETKEKRMKKILEMMAKGEKLHG